MSRVYSHKPYAARPLLPARAEAAALSTTSSVSSMSSMDGGGAAPKEVCPTSPLLGADPLPQPLQSVRIGLPGTQAVAPPSYPPSTNDTMLQHQPFPHSQPPQPPSHASCAPYHHHHYHHHHTGWAPSTGGSSSSANTSFESEGTPPGTPAACVHTTAGPPPPYSALFGHGATKAASPTPRTYPTMATGHLCVQSDGTRIASTDGPSIGPARQLSEACDDENKDAVTDTDASEDDEACDVEALRSTVYQEYYALLQPPCACPGLYRWCLEESGRLLQSWLPAETTVETGASLQVSRFHTVSAVRLGRAVEAKAPERYDRVIRRQPYSGAFHAFAEAECGFFSTVFARDHPLGRGYLETMSPFGIRPQDRRIILQCPVGVDHKPEQAHLDAVVGALRRKRYKAPSRRPVNPDADERSRVGLVRADLRYLRPPAIEARLAGILAALQLTSKGVNPRLFRTYWTDAVPYLSIALSKTGLDDLHVLILRQVPSIAGEWVEGLSREALKMPCLASVPLACRWKSQTAAHVELAARLVLKDPAAAASTVDRSACFPLYTIRALAFGIPMFNVMPAADCEGCLPAFCWNKEETGS